MATDPIRHRPAKAWQKVSITADSRMTDAVAAFLSDLTGSGLEISAVENGQVPAGRVFPTEKITGYIATEAGESDQQAGQQKIEGLREFMVRLSQVFPDYSVPLLHTETIIEEDWGKKWKSFFTSFHITPTLVIKPSWEEMEEHGNWEGGQKYVIEMDPGLAFGTGHHASTQLALLLLETLFQQHHYKIEKVLDVGTGSGILAMACGLFGAREILAVDNDPDAVETAKQNIARNHLEDKVTASGQATASLAAGFDIVVANITHDTLAALAATLARLVMQNGFLVLSGILKGEQEDSMREIYTRLGLKLIKNLARDEWAALLFQKK